MYFKVVISGKTPQELRANIREYLGLDKETGPQPAADQVENISRAATHEPAFTADENPVGVHPKFPDALRATVPHIPSASVPSVSTSATVSRSPGANDYGLDSRGLPWDDRIHSVTQAKVKDGAWRYKRGVEDAQIRVVEQELIAKSKQIQGAQMVEAGPAYHPPVPSAVPHPVHVPVIPAAPVPAAVAPPPMPPPQPPVPSAHSLKTFKETLVPTLAKLVRDGKLTEEYLKSLCAHYGVDMIHKVNDQQLAELFDGFVQYGMIVKAE